MDYLILESCITPPNKNKTENIEYDLRIQDVLGEL